MLNLLRKCIITLAVLYCTQSSEQFVRSRFDYKLKGGTITNYLSYMEDVKLYSTNEKDILIIHLTRVFSYDIGSLSAWTPHYKPRLNYTHSGPLATQ